jgi:hypothetical protein
MILSGLNVVHQVHYGAHSCPCISHFSISNGQKYHFLEASHVAKELSLLFFQYKQVRRVADSSWPFPLVRFCHFCLIAKNDKFFPALHISQAMESAPRKAHLSAVAQRNKLGVKEEDWRLPGTGPAVVSRARFAGAGRPNLERKAELYYDVSSDEELLELSSSEEEVEEEEMKTKRKRKPVARRRSQMQVASFWKSSH